MEMTITFGKYKGKTIEEVWLIHPSYFSWMRENRMTNKPEYQEFIETIPYKYPERFEWEIDIRSGYQCWKCKKTMQIFLMFNPEIENELRYGYPIISDLAYNKPRSLIPFAKEYGILLEERYSKVTESKYIMHICPHCKMHQGDNYVVEDNEQETKLIKKIKIIFDHGTWKEKN
ncbi:exodeoxyribonuclease X C-terminal domain-containing protein [Paenibacillus tyrfis]|uniref:Exodeoxyribonuclease X-like C-terminal domain-containing protein n=1 Tax=Paenibacillus tyrfis TaxID=1501230 RepID=A0A081NUL1_9BACL|nr:hypothetical protein [Paenibacillus tyrfis]KEQ22134.1 hypothetical protein ET33_27635 [Paenibacillus tyrfis]